MADMKSIRHNIRAIVATALCLAGIGGLAPIAMTQTPVPNDSVVSIVNRIRYSDCIRIELPDRLADRMARIVRPLEEPGAENEAALSKPVRRAGYRILAFDDNNPRTA